MSCCLSVVVALRFSFWVSEANLAVSAMALRVRSGAKSKTYHSVFILPSLLI